MRHWEESRGSQISVSFESLPGGGHRGCKFSWVASSFAGHTCMRACTPAQTCEFGCSTEFHPHLQAPEPLKKWSLDSGGEPKLCFCKDAKILKNNQISPATLLLCISDNPAEHQQIYTGLISHLGQERLDLCYKLLAGVCMHDPIRLLLSAVTYFCLMLHQPRQSLSGRHMISGSRRPEMLCLNLCASVLAGSQRPCLRVIKEGPSNPSPAPPHPVPSVAPESTNPLFQQAHLGGTESSNLFGVRGISF